MAMKELQHGSHECVLTSTEKDAIGICNICFKDESVKFSCVPCNFDLCSACSDLPQKVSHEFHSEHPLEFCLRKVDQIPEHIICSGCGTMSSGSFYKCKECEIYLDLDCALLPNIFRRWDTKPELHYSHAHLLNRCRPGPNVRDSCLLCELPLSPLSICYGCVHCYSFTHEHCLNFPMEIQHPVHPEHPLKRLDFTQNCDPGLSCTACGNNIVSVPIGCLECELYLHLRCADSLLRGLMHKSHQHTLFYVATGAKDVFQKSRCEICKRIGVISLESFYQCVECGWKIHFECFEIPWSVVKKNFHIHPLACKIYVAKDDSLEYCGVCETMVHVGHHAYSCKECDFVGHIECILRKEAPSPLYLKDLFSCGKYVTRGTNRDDCETEKLENKLMVNDMGHIHVLRSVHKSHQRCEICNDIISSSSWKCETCEFEAHDSCAKLGKPLRRRLHLNHELTLLPIYPAGFIMNCNTCKVEIVGFNLFCRICNLITCMKCVVKFDQLLGVLHRGQKVIGTTEVKCRKDRHRLFQVKVSSSYPIDCTICDEKLCGKVVSCMECGEIYHPHCIELFIRKQLNHPIHSDHKLEVKLQRGSTCTACKLNITVYGFFCSICEVSFHIKCIDAVDASGKNNFHKHTLYNFWDGDSKVTRACCVCGRPCYASFYGCIDCNFSSHVDCLGFPANVKSQLHQHMVVEEDVWGMEKCALCKTDCRLKRYSCKQCKDVFHKKCLLSQEAREAATEEEQLGDVYFMYIERLLVNMFEEEKENEEKEEKLRREAAESAKYWEKMNHNIDSDEDNELSYY